MKKRLIIQFAIMTLLLLTTVTITSAYQINPSYKPINEPFGLEEETIESGANAANATNLILQIIAGGLLYFAAPVGVIMIAINGFTIVIGGADTEKIEQAKKNLTWSIVGLLLIILSYSAVRIIIGLIVKAAEGAL